MQNTDKSAKTQQTKFNFKDFASLVKQIKPHFWQLIVGVLLGIIATGSQLIVPKIAQKLVNQLHHSINTKLVIIRVFK
ncbi:hypothetical protein AH70_02725 [Pediococcus damnosus LMG 28219]|uniref:hypothetical protein n=1 Tax=Pediococcus damnosus TaxID=51663 RepID=UPI00061E2072|nr:hypothetical protein [Pediococcus damnosus]KJU73274.1 hypothetical protein AH70_02725 [Pediococcus damnosus LMG 28219]